MVGRHDFGDDEFSFQDYQLENIVSLSEKGLSPSQIKKNESELPGWLQESIDECPDYLRPILVYQFLWKDSIHYLVYHPFMNGPYDGFFTKDGEHIDGHKLWEDIKANSHGWALIYIAQPKDAKE